MFKSFFILIGLLIFLGFFYSGGNLIMLLLFLEILVLSIVFLILSSSFSILLAFNLSILFMVFSVIAATLGLTILGMIFKGEDSKLLKSQFI